MRRILIFIMSCSLMTQAQVFRKVSMEKLNESQSNDCRMAGISPDGSYILTTTQTSKGLRRINLQTGEQTQLTDVQGAGFQPSISSDGRQILCRKVTFDKNHMRQTALQLIDLDKGLQKQFRAPAREVHGYKLDEHDPHARPRAEVFIEDLQLMVTVNGVTTNISPNGTDEDTRYIWPSLSPDGQRILYYVSGVGAFVCNLEGKEVQFIAHDCRAPQWYDDEIIIGMNDQDDGEMLLSSSIMAYSLSGEVQELTDPKDMFMYPQCCALRGIIACSSANGEISIMKVEK